MKHIEEIMNSKEGEQIGEDLVKTAAGNQMSSLDRATLPKVDDADDISFTEAGHLHSELQTGSGSSKHLDNVISTHIESVEDLFGQSEKKELSAAYDKAGIKEPEKSNAEKQKEMAEESLGALVDQEAEQKAKSGPAAKKEEKKEEAPKDHDQEKLEQLSAALDEENKEAAAEPGEKRASLTEAAGKDGKKDDEPKEDGKNEAVKPEEPLPQEQAAPEAVAQTTAAKPAEPSLGVPSGTDITATLDAYIAQQTAAGHDVDITKIDPEAIAQLMNQPAGAAPAAAVAQPEYFAPAAPAQPIGPSDVVASTIAQMKAAQGAGQTLTAPLGGFIAQQPTAPTPVAAAPAQPAEEDEASEDGPKLSDADQFEKDTTTLTKANEETSSQM